MKHAVIKKQNNAKLCFVCGLGNELGLHASFYETDSGELVAVVRPKAEHQSYPGRMHGGIAAALLDETIGRSVAIGKDDQVWGVTVELTTKYLKPVPLDCELRAVARVTRDSGRVFEGTGEIILPDGEVAVRASGKYLKVPLSRITDAPMDGDDWSLHLEPEDPETLELPERE